MVWLTTAWDPLAKGATGGWGQGTPRRFVVGCPAFSNVCLATWSSCRPVAITRPDLRLTVMNWQKINQDIMQNQQLRLITQRIAIRARRFDSGRRLQSLPARRAECSENDTACRLRALGRNPERSEKNPPACRRRDRICRPQVPTRSQIACDTPPGRATSPLASPIHHV